MSIFTGAGVALVTPMHADGSVNFDKMKELIEFQIANDTDALIICGTTGEASTMSFLFARRRPFSFAYSAFQQVC